jgi:hypothetical protein
VRKGLQFLSVLVTAAIQLLLWRDKRTAAKATEEESLPGYDSPPSEPSNVDEKKAVCTNVTSLGLE